MTISIEKLRRRFDVQAARAFLAHALRLESLRRMLDGDPLAFEEQPSPPNVAARIRSEQLSNVARNTPIMMLATCFNAILFAIVMWETSRADLAWFWTAIIMALATFMYLKRKGATRAAPRHASSRGIRLAIAYALLHGSLWGVLPAVFFFGAGHSQQLVIVCLCIGMMCGGAFALSPIPVAMVAYVAPIVAGSTIAIIVSGDPIYNVVAGMMLVYTLVMYAAVMSRAIVLARRCAAEVEAEDSALRDELTQLPNRTSFKEELVRAFSRYERSNECFAVMCFDLDCFKVINDTMGHAAGDQALVETARRLKQVTRDVDMVVRLGGDEFALIAANIRTKNQATALAERIVTAFRAPFWIEGHDRAITISVGVALAPADGVDLESLVRNADSALYATKHSGRGGYTFFRDRFGFVAEHATLETELSRAFANCELYLVFQPFVNMATLRTTGFEALLRWRHPVRGILNAAEIVPLFERSGLIDEVGAWAVEEAIAIAADWPPHLRLAVNVSSLQLRKPTLEITVRRALAAHGFDPRRLEIELTESATILDGERAAATLAALGGLGITTALDNLGTGFSTLASLVELPLDRLKIDRSFVANIDTNPMCASVVKISIELARALELKITAEGVEDARQLDFLRAFGCLEAQGYLFSRPVQASELAPMFISCGLTEAAPVPLAALAS
jgi:diguanylate cyclase (GGDEF)-like protein